MIQERHTDALDHPDSWVRQTAQRHIYERQDGNAIALAHKPFWDEMWQRYAHTLIVPYGTRVGLPPGQMGNSEVGHLNMGAGRIVRMDISRIDHAIETDEFFHNAAFKGAIAHAQNTGGALHFHNVPCHVTLDTGCH